MSNLAPYVNEFVSFLVMILLLAAFISGQLNARTQQLASASEDAAEISHVRMQGE